MKRQTGLYAVEFAIVGLLVMILLLAVLEFGRAMFTINTLNESVRRGARLAAVCNIQDPVVLRRAAFADADNTEGTLIRNLDSADLSLRYLDENGAAVADPGPAGNFYQIRFVEVSIQSFQFQLLIPIFGSGIELGPFRAVLPRESLGRHAEQGVAPEITPC